MTSTGALFSLQESVRKSHYHVGRIFLEFRNYWLLTDARIADIGIPGIRHFLYKSKSSIQFTMPLFSEPYKNDEKEQKR
jgi:hypothetical protein